MPVEGVEAIALKKMFGTGYIGVDIFLFVSAYGLSYSYKNNTINDYYFRRLKKIYPLYFLFLCCFYCTMIIIGNKEYEDLNTYIYQGTGLSVFKCFSVKIEWFTPSLIAIYLVFPLLYEFLKYISRSVKFQIAVLILSFVLPHVLCQVVILPLSFRLPIIVLGILTYFNINNNKISELIYIYCVAIFLSFITKIDMLRYSLCVPSFLFLMNSVFIDKNNLIYKSISKIGKYTFEIYLAQVITTKFILRSDIICLPLLVLLVIILTIFFSFLFYWGTKILLAIKMPSSSKNTNS